MENKICVYAIAKNEGKFVDRWFESMKEADVIVVLDTGSTDDTVEKLKSHGVKVEIKEIKPWRFDVARNESLKLVPEDCNILVCTDLDEVFSPGWAELLKTNWVEGKHSRALYKFNWSHFHNGEPAITFNYNKVHDRTWKWKYPVHEILCNKDTEEEIYAGESELNLFDQITLDHYQDREKSRKSYLDLLEVRAQEHPNDDLFGKLYLSQEYHYRQMFDKSTETFRKTLANFDQEMIDIERASCYWFIGENYLEQKNYGEALSAFVQGIKADPTYRECYIGAAKAYIDLEQYRLAAETLRDGLHNSYRHFSWLEGDVSWSYEPYDLLCHAYFQSGQMLKALACGYKALTYYPQDRRLNNNVLACLDNLTDQDF